MNPIQPYTVEVRPGTVIVRGPAGVTAQFNEPDRLFRAIARADRLNTQHEVEKTLMARENALISTLTDAIAKTLTRGPQEASEASSALSGRSRMYPGAY